MDVIVTNPRRAREGAVSPADFPDLPVTEVTWARDGSGNLVVQTDRDLTAEEQQTVIHRCESLNANEEELRRRVRAAMQRNRDFLALTSPTNAEVLEQVQLLTRECQGLIRMAVRDLDDID